MRRFLVGSALMLLSLMGCAYKTIQVNYMRPAEVNLKGIKQIAIGGVYGYGPYEVAASSMKGQLEESIFNSGRFTLVDRSRTQQVLGELALVNSGIFDTSKAPQLGKLLPASIFIYATVNRDDTGTRVDRSEQKTSEGNVYYRYTRTSWGETEVSFQVIDCETGVILAVKTLRGRAEDIYSEDNNSNPRYADYNPLLDNARNKVIAAFMKVIAPYEDTANVRFAKQKKVPQVEQGIGLVRVGDWAGSIQAFEAAYAAYPNDSRVIYNLGLSYEYTFQFARAEEMFTKAYKLEPKNSTYKNEIENCRRLRAEYEKLQAQ
jgi:Curli production assembly/transport component CsgG/Tetratricopeptide repeat